MRNDSTLPSRLYLQQQNSGFSQSTSFDQIISPEICTNMNDDFGSHFPFQSEEFQRTQAQLNYSGSALSSDYSYLPEGFFINKEFNGRVSVAVLFYKLAEMESRNDSFAALESGKLFLLELLDSAIHRHKVAEKLHLSICVCMRTLELVKSTIINHH